MKSFKIFILLFSAYLIQSCTISPFYDDSELLVDRTYVSLDGEYRCKGVNNHCFISETFIGYELSVPCGGAMIEIENSNDLFSVYVNEYYNNIVICPNEGVVQDAMDAGQPGHFEGSFIVRYKNQVIPIDVKMDVKYTDYTFRSVVLTNSDRKQLELSFHKVNDNLVHIYLPQYDLTFSADYDMYTNSLLVSMNSGGYYQGHSMIMRPYRYRDDGSGPYVWVNNKVELNFTLDGSVKSKTGLWLGYTVDDDSGMGCFSMLPWFS